MQRIFVRRVSFGFGNGLRRTGDFLYLRLLVVMLFAGPFSVFVGLLELVLIVFVLFDFRCRPFVGFVFFVVLFDRFIFFEDGAARNRGRLHFLANQVLLGFDHTGGKLGRFLFTDVDFFASALRLGGFTIEGRFLLRLVFGGCRAACFL